MKLGAGYPMGPFELADYVGLDTTKFIIDGEGNYLEPKHVDITFNLEVWQPLILWSWTDNI